jgi:hypothetical protein
VAPSFGQARSLIDVDFPPSASAIPSAPQRFMTGMPDSLHGFSVTDRRPRHSGRQARVGLAIFAHLPFGTPVIDQRLNGRKTFPRRLPTVLPMLKFTVSLRSPQAGRRRATVPGCTAGSWSSLAVRSVAIAPLRPIENAQSRAKNSMKSTDPGNSCGCSRIGAG